RAARRARGRGGTGVPATARGDAAAIAVRGTGGAPQAGAGDDRPGAAHPPRGAGGPGTVRRCGAAGRVRTITKLAKRTRTVLGKQGAKVPDVSGDRVSVADPGQLPATLRGAILNF